MERIRYSPAELISLYTPSDPPPNFLEFGPVAYQSKFKPLRCSSSPTFEHRPAAVRPDKPADQFASVLHEEPPKPQTANFPQQQPPQQQQQQQPFVFPPQPYGYYAYPAQPYMYQYPNYGFAQSGFGENEFPGVNYAPQFVPQDEAEFPSVVGNESPSFAPESAPPGFAPKPADRVESCPREAPSFAPKPVEGAAVSRVGSAPQRLSAKEKEFPSFAPRHVEEHGAVSFAPKPAVEQTFDADRDFPAIVGFAPKKQTNYPSFAPKPVEEFSGVVGLAPQKDSGFPSFAPKKEEETFSSVIGNNDSAFPGVLSEQKQDTRKPHFAPMPLSDFSPTFAPKQDSAPGFQPKQMPPRAQSTPIPPVPVPPEEQLVVTVAPERKKVRPVPFSVLEKQEQAQKPMEGAKPANAPIKAATKSTPSFNSLLQEEGRNQAKRQNSMKFSPKLISQSFYVSKTPIPDISQAVRLKPCTNYARKFW